MDDNQVVTANNCHGTAGDRSLRGEEDGVRHDDRVLADDNQCRRALEHCLTREFRNDTLEVCSASSDFLHSYAVDPRNRRVLCSATPEKCRSCLLYRLAGTTDGDAGTTAMTSISSISSGRARCTTWTSVLAGVAVPKYLLRASRIA